MRLEVTLDELHEIRVALSVAGLQLEEWAITHATNEDKDRIEMIWALLDRLPIV